MKTLDLKKIILIGLILIVAVGILCICFGNSNNRSSQETSFNNFVSWMKAHNYSKSIIGIYECNYRDPVLRLIIEEYFRVKKGNLKWPDHSLIGYNKFKSADNLVLNFVEVIPTDKGARFYEVDLGVLKKFNNYLKKRFGKDIIINHKKIVLNYNEVFGDIFYSYESLFEPKINPKLAIFMEQFDPPCIIKFDAEYINDDNLAVILNIRRCAVVIGREYRLLDDMNVFDEYAHEFGHNIGLVHQFIDPKNPLRGNISMETIQSNKGRYVGVDDIMIKSKESENEIFGHYLSPLSRYVLEPVNGYEDNDEFGVTYSNLYSQESLEKIKQCACKE